MDEIYSNTTKNLIWLGEEDTTTREALAGLRQILRDMKHQTNDFREATGLIHDDNGNRNFSSDGFAFGLPTEAISKYFNSPWFSRLWIIQEAALASENVCYRGSYTTPLEDILRPAVWLRYKLPHIDASLASHEGLLKAVRLQSLTDRKLGYYRDPGDEPDLAQILLECSYFDTSQRQDHVFGILGLLRKISTLRDVPKPLNPDYSKPVLEVFAKATRLCIEERRDLIMLTWIGPRNGKDVSSDLPTWAVDFGLTTGYQDGASNIDNALFCAGDKMGLDPFFACSDHWSRLILKGFVVNEVRAMSDIIPRSAFDLVSLCKSRLNW